jgi:hypothetical protein
MGTAAAGGKRRAGAVDQHGARLVLQWVVGVLVVPPQQQGKKDSGGGSAEAAAVQDARVWRACERALTPAGPSTTKGGPAQPSLATTLPQASALGLFQASASAVFAEGTPSEAAEAAVRAVAALTGLSYPPLESWTLYVSCCRSCTIRYDTMVARLHPRLTHTPPIFLGLACNKQGLHPRRRPPAGAGGPRPRARGHRGDRPAARQPPRPVRRGPRGAGPAVPDARADAAGGRYAKLSFPCCVWSWPCLIIDPHPNPHDRASARPFPASSTASSARCSRCTAISRSAHTTRPPGRWRCGGRSTRLSGS